MSWKKNEPLKDRIDRKSIVRQSGCIEWGGRVEKTGYGALRYAGKRLKAHRAAWMANNGEIPDGLLVLHHCDNRKCINPDHLFLGTQLDNMRDMIAKGRKRPTFGAGHGMAKLTAPEVIEIRKRIEKGELQKHLAVEYGVSKSMINRISMRLNWTHV